MVVMQTVADAIALLRGTDYDARSLAERFLARTAPFEGLLPHLTDTDWKVRLFVARAIAQFPTPPRSRPNCNLDSKWKRMTGFETIFAGRLRLTRRERNQFSAVAPLPATNKAG